MKIDRKEMKRAARLAMREHKPSIYLITLVFLVILAVLEALSLKLQFPGVRLAEIYRLQLTEEGMLQLIQIAGRGSFIGRVLYFAISIMTGVLTAGFSLVCLNVSRRLPASVGTLLDPFAILLKVFWLNLVMGVFIFLWSLLLIVPGIIAAYRYSMAMFILLDDPDKSVMQCIRESKEMTYGHKTELFVLDLSFIGWSILSVIPFVSLFTMPYMSVVHANYYNVLSGTGSAETYPPDPWET